MNPQPQWLTRQQVAYLLGVTMADLVRMEQRGDLPKADRGKYPTHDVEALLEARREVTA